MSSSRYLRGDLLEVIARNALKKYDPHLVIGMGVQRVPIEEIIESMGLTIEYQYIRRDGRILGETVFDDGYIPLYDMKKRKYGLFFMSRGTIIIDASLLGDKTDSRLRFTCAHELAHWLIHQELYRGSGEAAAMANNISKSSDTDRCIERQADILAGALLMPIGKVKQAFYRISGENGIEVLAKEFGVSKESMKIRLREHGLI